MLLAILDKACEHLIFIEPSHGGTQFDLTVAGGKLLWADEFGLKMVDLCYISHIDNTPNFQVASLMGKMMMNHRIFGASYFRQTHPGASGASDLSTAHHCQDTQPTGFTCVLLVFHSVFYPGICISKIFQDHINIKYP